MNRISLSCVVALLSIPLSAHSAAMAAALPLEAVVAEHDIDFFVGVQPSPDGRWIAFDDADARESLNYEYANQSFTHTGYPMWSSLSVFRKRLIDLSSGRVERLPSAVGYSWGGAWSPDGTQYAFYSDRAGMANLWIWDRATGRTRQLNSDVIRMFRNNDFPLWTPDGKGIVYRTLPESTTLADFERLDPGYAAETHQTSNVRLHVYSSDEVRSKSDEPVVKPTLPWYWDARFLDDVVVADTATGVSRRLATRVHPLVMALSPDGHSLAFLDADHPIPNTQTAAETLKVVPLAGGPVRTLANDVIAADPAAFTWSPNSERIAYPSHEGASFDIRVCHVVNVADGTTLKLSNIVPGRIGSLRWGAPLWSQSGDVLYLLDTPEPSSRGADSHLWAIRSDGTSAREVGQVPGHRIEDIVRTNTNTYWSPDGGATLITRTHAMQSKRDGFFAVDLKSGRARPLFESDVRIFKPITAAAGDTHHITFFQESARQPVEAYSLDVVNKTIKQLSALHPLVDPNATGTTRLVDWMSEAGEPLQGTLLLPPRADPHTRLPLVVWVYGGNRGSDSLNRYGFGWEPAFNAQVLATRGYAVLYPDIPMHAGTPVQDLSSAVIPAINKLVELRIVDPERLAVMGQSFGGYNTLSLITHTTRFKAAVITGSAASDLFEGYSRFSSGSSENIGYYEQGQGSMLGTPWELPIRYFENSPFFYLDRVTTPVFIARGTDDPISSGSGAIFTALRRLHKPVELIEYEHEGHVVQDPKNVTDLWERRLEWLARYLVKATP